MRFTEDLPQRIEDYALIGDCETAALVSRCGSIDWLCWPRFDSGACFAALLGDRFNGRFLIRPLDADAHNTRRYRDGSLVLETCWRTKTGRALVTDFMPLRDGASDVIRIVRGLEGCVDFFAEYILRFDYGRVTPWVNRLEDGALRAVGGPDSVVLRTKAPLHPRGRTHAAEFSMRAGEEICFHLAWTPSHLPHARGGDHHKALEQTDAFWTQWSARCSSAGPYSGLVKRSLITLKALTYAPTGGIVAAPTTSLPEEIGGERNWDYRYCWLRDATFTLLALMDAGYYEEAEAWRDWLFRAAAGDPAQLQIMYGIGGERRLTEETLHWLKGFGKSQPVRIGNGAATQLQLDVFGEVLDCLYQGRCGGLAENHLDWRCSRRCSTNSTMSGASRTRGCGRCADRCAISPPRKCSSGSLTTGRSRRSSGSGSSGRAGAPARRARPGASRHPAARVRSRAGLVRPELRLEGARREPAADPARRLPAAG